MGGAASTSKRTSSVSWRRATVRSERPSNRGPGATSRATAGDAGGKVRCGGSDPRQEKAFLLAAHRMGSCAVALLVTGLGVFSRKARHCRFVARKPAMPATPPLTKRSLGRVLIDLRPLPRQSQTSEPPQPRSCQNRMRGPSGEPIFLPRVWAIQRTEARSCHEVCGAGCDRLRFQSGRLLPCHTSRTA